MNKKEVAAFVRNNIEDYEERLQLALKRMDRMREPLRMADGMLHSEIVDAINDWSWDNEVNTEDWDIDDLIEGDEGIIWEE